MYRKFLVFILVIILSSYFSAAQLEKEEEEAKPYQKFSQTFPGQNIQADGVSAFQDNGDGTYTVTVTSYTKDGVTYRNGVNVVLDKDGNIMRAGEITMPNGAKLTNANFVTGDKDRYQAQSVGQLQQGTIIITNGVNVAWNNGVLTADSAASLDYKGSTSTDVVKLTADSKEFSVQRAAAVQAGCFLVEDVKIARFVVGQKDVTMTTSGDGKVVYGDGAKIAYDGLAANSTLIGSVTNCKKPTYKVYHMELTSTRDGLKEVVNGSGQIEMDGLYGVVCVNLTPISTYDVDDQGYENDFGFLIKEYAYKLCIQKNIVQKLEADCPLCGLVDLANKKLLLNGVIEYRRYWYDSALIEPQKQRAFRSLGFGKNVIDFFQGDVRIEQDAPGIGTYVSNYLELHEHPVDGRTHRFLAIHEKVDRVAQNWARTYTAAYAPATTTIVDNNLDYTRSGCHVGVLQPNSPAIAAALSDLQQQEVLFR